MAILQQITRRPQDDRPEITNTEDRIVDNVDQMNNENYKWMLRVGYSKTEARNICQQHQKEFITKNEYQWE